MRLLYRAARLIPPPVARAAVRRPRRVVHISPAYFSDDSLIGGGERYATSLAEAIADQVDTTLVSFGRARQTLWRGKLRLEIYPVIEWIEGVTYNPLCYSFLTEIIGADVVHCHQYWTVVTALSILAGRCLQKRVFVTDYGGWRRHTLPVVSIAEFVDGFLPISEFSARTLPQHRNVRVIYGGAERDVFDEAAEAQRERKVLFVGRIMPHKGINYLIEAIGEDVPLDIIGRVYDEGFFLLLKKLAENKRVRFITAASDEDVRRAYQSALVTVLPSVYLDVNGARHLLPEIMPLVLIESMACGTPVICTDVGGMPEIVEDEVTGFIVPPNDPAALRKRIDYLMSNPEVALAMGRRARHKVRGEFTWEAAAERCLQAYASL